MEQTRELVFAPKPLTVEIPNAAKLRDMFLVGGKIKYDAKGNPSTHDLEVTPSSEQIEKFLLTQKEAFPKGSTTKAVVKDVKVLDHKGTVKDPWNELSYEFSFSAEKTDEVETVWSLSYRVTGDSESMTLIPSEFTFAPSL